MGSMGIKACKARRRRSSAMAVALACLLTMPVAGGQNDGGDDGYAFDGPAAPNLIPVLSISLSPSQLEAVVTQDQLGAVTFEGEVTVDQLRVMSSTVTQQAVVSTGWPVVISPTTIKFAGPGTESFTVTVIVPPGTSALMTGNVLVTASCKAPGLSPVVASANAVVTVKGYYLLTIESEDPVLTLSPGESGEVKLQVWNRGNGMARVSASVGPKPESVRFEFSADVFMVESEEYHNLTIKITATESAPRGSHEVIVLFTLAEGEPSEGSYHASFPITLNIPTIAATIGYPVIAALVVLSCVGVAVAVLWKKGKLSMLKELKLPKRTKAEA